MHPSPESSSQRGPGPGWAAVQSRRRSAAGGRAVVQGSGAGSPDAARTVAGTGPAGRARRGSEVRRDDGRDRDVRGPGRRLPARRHQGRYSRSRTSTRSAAGKISRRCWRSWKQRPGRNPSQKTDRRERRRATGVFIYPWRDVTMCYQPAPESTSSSPQRKRNAAGLRCLNAVNSAVGL
jgi:hypothetical protein